MNATTVEGTTITRVFFKLPAKKGKKNSIRRVKGNFLAKLNKPPRYNHSQVKTSCIGNG